MSVPAAESSVAVQRRTHTLGAMRRLSGGISHDFNNLLQALRSTLELIDRQPGDEKRVRQWAQSALLLVDRGARLTSQLLAFSSAQHLQPRPVAVDPLLQGLQEMLQRSLGPLAHVQVEVEPAAGSVMADLAQLELALLNLAINANDAMPAGGLLTLSARRLRLQTDPELADGDYVSISVADTGSGMSDKVRERAFEPFFTTKTVGRGSGLGLAQVYGFARQSSGSARIVSTSPRGTTVSVVLPSANGVNWAKGANSATAAASVATASASPSALRWPAPDASTAEPPPGRQQALHS